MIEARELAKKYGDFEALQPTSFRIEPGQVCGYLGPNGAGKSTTVRMLIGLSRPTSGSVSICGFDAIEQPLEVKRRIGYVPETGKVFSTLTVEEFLTLVGTLHEVSADLLDARISEYLKLFDIPETRQKRLDALSKGMRQKVVLTAALMHQPEVLILDEPLSGLDVNAMSIMKDLIRRLADEGKTVFYCSHVLEVVERVCDRVIILNRGAKLADGSPKELMAENGGKTLEEVFRRLTNVAPVNS